MKLNRLKDLREDIDAKQEKIAQFLGITRQQYSLYETGKRSIPIEYVKELLSYRQLNITEIADIAGYSSVAHLSRQFKSITGLTPSAFIKAALPRIPLNKV